MHAATRILQEKTHACGLLKRHNFRVHVSLGSAETLVRRGGIINHHSIAYSLSNISAKNYRNRFMWVESIVCNISVVFLRHSVQFANKAMFACCPCVVNDCMVAHLGMKFSTKDRDNDLANGSCAQAWKGGWWYKNCFAANLNGEYNESGSLKSIESSQRASHIIWCNGKYSMRFTEMKIRPYGDAR